MRGRGTELAHPQDANLTVLCPWLPQLPPPVFALLVAVIDRVTVCTEHVQQYALNHLLAQ